MTTFLLAALALQPKPPVTLNLSVGSRISSKLELHFTNAADEFDLLTRDIFESRIEKIENGEITINHAIRPVYLKMDGVERNTPEAEPADVTTVLLTNGTLKHYLGTVIDPKANLMISRFWTIPLPKMRPVVGSDWSFSDFREDAYKFTGHVIRETEKTLELDVTFEGLKDEPMNAKGKAILDLKTGWPMRIELQATNVLVPGGEGERVKLDLLFETTSFTAK